MLLAELAAAGTTLAAGAALGRYEMLRWNIWNRKNRLILVLGLAVIFLPGSYLMKIYGYHFLKIIRYWILMYALVLLALVDMEKKIIPNKALLVLVGVRTLFMTGECFCFPELSADILVSSGAGLVGGGLLFLLAGLVIRKGLGMGDVKLIAVMGYYLGFQVLMSSLIITLTMTVAAGILILVLKKGSLHTEMPFAPFAAAGTIITILMGF